MKTSPRPTTPELQTLLKTARKAKQQPLIDRLTKLLWLRKRQKARRKRREKAKSREGVRRYK